MGTKTIYKGFVMTPITKEGYEKQKEILRKLKEEFDKMPAMIGTAREKGDLKENAEYHAAKDRQGMLQAQMNKIGSILADAQIIDPAALNKEIVTFGKRVKVKDMEANTESTYRIVGELEFDIDKGEISINTPIAKGFLGKKLNDEVSIQVPAGIKKYKIINISV